MHIGAAERTKAAALNFHSKAVFSEKLWVGANTSISIISSSIFCGFKVDKVVLTGIRQTCRAQSNDMHALILSDFS